ncbi:MFS transporter, MCP family, solute carrier family 16, member 6 [Amniculicola lignicola CBS 123094]|uniref:MFS transporter, MCP family, solute carrier family 16, member 6 n=1 Tax=Amniculicola lignicola CBS 123094 TaxID=1392246 RepID=A0A6A5WPZ1_9PLEO|nr:MFS transporter, MCP family, solute carrier family 16, member 6 [Amniculicola lignicola CBS 123094]
MSPDSPAVELENSRPQQEHEIQEAPPDGGYGWVVVGACAAVNCFTWGVTSSYGVYLSEYLTSNMFPGAKSMDYGFVGGFNFAFAMLIAPLATFLTARLGKHTVMLTGSVIQCAAYISASFATVVWHLYVTQGALVGCGIGLMIVPSMAILSQWFSKKRSVANGISSAGSGIGGVAFSWGTRSMIDRVGLHWTLRITGLVTLVATTIATLLIRDRNHHIQPNQLAFDISLLRQYKVVLLLLWAFVSMFGYIALLFSLSDFALSIGLSHDQATDIVGFLNLGTAIGRPIIGIVSDRFSRVKTAGVLTFCCGLICFALWMPAKGFGLTVFFALLCGAILGVFWMTISPLCVEVAGLKELPSLLSLSWATIILPTTFAEAIALHIRRPDAQREYLYPQIFAGLSYLLASIFMFELWRVLRRPT